MDRIIDFNDIKSKAEQKNVDKDVDKFETYLYDLYYRVAQGTLSMADFTKQIFKYMEENNISHDKFLEFQKNLMQRYGFDTDNIENELKTLGLNLNKNINFNGNASEDYESIRKAMSFNEKYKDRIKIKNTSIYNIKNDVNDVEIILDEENVNLKSFKRIDLNDNELNEFLCSYKKVREGKKLKVSLCENVLDYIY